MTRTLAALLIAAGAAACSQPSPWPDAIVVGVTSSPTTLDPGVGVDEASQKIGQLLFSSLVKIDGTLRVVPDLATRFETTDWQTFTATIPAGVRFHDGREMTSADVAYTFRRFLDPAFTSARKGAYRDLAAVDIVDPYTVAFRLKAPSASFPVNLVMGIVPAGTGAEAGRQPIGSGPYRMAEFVPDDHVTLLPFADHYRGAPRNAGLVLKVVPDETMRGLELRKGSVDIVVNDLAPDLVHGLQEEGRLQVVTAPGTDYAYIGLNLRDPVLADRRVRQAIAYAVDRDAIVNYLRRGFAAPATTIVPPMSWAAAADVPAFPHDPARAMALLDEAGFRDPDGAGPAPRLHLSLKTSTNEAYRLQAAVLQQQLSQVGIALELRSYELATLFADVTRGNVQLYTLQFVGVTDPDMLRRAFETTQVPPSGFNRGHYSNPEVDRLIAAATIALDEAERGRLYGEAQRLIAADVPLVSLWVKTNVAVAQANLTGLSLSPTADFTFLAGVARIR
ncbi:MAG TPA: ABC transporter substrate-binding protein [Vicinamibacterales bacterium]|nr:ABC transporter substrate-binding protein [Vicinamibacterales bacterium]